MWIYVLAMAMSTPPTLVLDNGGGTIKVAWSTYPSDIRIVPNNICRGRKERRNFIGDQVEMCGDFNGLFYRLPCQRGLLVNWEVEQQVWKHIFSPACCSAIPSESSLLLTECVLNPPNLQRIADEIVFEEFGFQSFYRCSAPTLSASGASMMSNSDNASIACLVIDAGYSFTHIVPYFRGRMLNGCIQRINIGGKAITNQLKEVISYRQINMLEETYITNVIKERCCYISNDFNSDMAIARRRDGTNSILREYVLPDYVNSKTGYLKEEKYNQTKCNLAESDEQVVLMNNERFAVTEMLFRPSDVHLNQAGIAESVVNAISRAPADLQPLLYSCILITGGCAKLPGFRDRVLSDVRMFAPDHMEVNVFECDDPIGFACLSGCKMATKDDFAKRCVSKQEWAEHGEALCRSRFFN